jgi:hypothetical protein
MKEQTAEGNFGATANEGTNSRREFWCHSKMKEQTPEGNFGVTANEGTNSRRKFWCHSK